MRAAALLLLLLVLPAAAGPADWRRAEWGMDAAALEAAVGPALRTLPGAFRYGDGLTARHAQDGAEIGGLVFRALFQISEARGLSQILFERRGAQAAPRDAAALIAGLRADYGPEDAACTVAQGPDGRLGGEWVWRRPEGVIRAVALDFALPGVADPDAGDRVRPPSRDPEDTEIQPPEIPESLRLTPRTKAQPFPDTSVDPRVNPRLDPRASLRPAPLRPAARRLLVRLRDPAYPEPGACGE